MADFQANIAGFEARNIPIFVDPLADAQALIDKLNLTFPIGYGLDYMEFGKKTGAFYEIEEPRNYLHATGFILRLDGTIAEAAYSVGPVGRFSAADCLRAIES